MTIATLICTMNRPAELDTGLTSLARQGRWPDQIVVSDDSAETDHRTEAVCRRFERVRYQRGPRRGLAANRNAALRAVSTDFVHFIDDDVTIPDGFYETFAALPGDEVGGRIVTGYERRHDPDGRVVDVLPPFAGFWGHLGPSNGSPPNCVVINAAIFPARFFREAAFDEYFRYGYEESDITLQAISRGYALIYEPRLSVDHYPSSANRDVYKGWVIGSQVYAGLKRQWTFERSLARTTAFGLVAIPRIIASTFRRHGARASAEACVQAARGTARFIRGTRQYW